ncbi:hypothetical protein [Streptomyces sp. NPDC001657]|uniref:hypothetical protein n=1 Tax=Streptomyces sp. NPDC001657 TaxID=3154522 RepID=UPI003320E44D
MTLRRRTLLAGGLAEGAGLTSGCAGKPLDTGVFDMLGGLLLTQAAHVPRTPATLTWRVLPGRSSCWC